MRRTATRVPEVLQPSPLLHALDWTHVTEETLTHIRIGHVGLSQLSLGYDVLLLNISRIDSERDQPLKVGNPLKRD